MGSDLYIGKITLVCGQEGRWMGDRGYKFCTGESRQKIIAVQERRWALNKASHYGEGEAYSV